MRYSPGDFIDSSEVQQARAQSPHARQLCHGGNRQLRTWDDRVAVCTECGRKWSTFDRHKDGSRGYHAIVPSHPPDREGARKIAANRVSHPDGGTPRPW